MEYRVKFTMPTKFIGADYEEEMWFEFDDDMDDIEVDAEIQDAFREWREEILADMRAWSEYEVL